ncbi:hypothetical protein PR048_023839 [Dryococelus australis]|uniref:Uncharacterized protein n=1 Tax=Dryococelus australis TaxID=614101 RepID=A0ABQ9GVB1_9NEOP|nr:hypothetical protein PR048_023839 [Dryococelus australis]
MEEAQEEQIIKGRGVKNSGGQMVETEDSKILVLQRSGRMLGTLAHSLPTKANWVQSPAGSPPEFCMWKLCWTMLLVGVFFQGSPIPLPFRSKLTSITLICSKDLVKRCQVSSLTHSNLSPPIPPNSTPDTCPRDMCRGGGTAHRHAASSALLQPRHSIVQGSLRAPAPYLHGLLIICPEHVVAVVALHQLASILAHHKHCNKPHHHRYSTPNIRKQNYAVHHRVSGDRGGHQSSNWSAAATQPIQRRDISFRGAILLEDEIPTISFQLGFEPQLQHAEIGHTVDCSLSEEGAMNFLVGHDTEHEWLERGGHPPLAGWPVQPRYRASLLAVTVLPLAGRPTITTTSGAPHFFTSPPAHTHQHTYVGTEPNGTGTDHPATTTSRQRSLLHFHKPTNQSVLPKRPTHAVETSVYRRGSRHRPTFH